MKTSTAEQIWKNLSAAGLVTGEITYTTDPHSPWFIRVMLGFAGWIGALFLLGFVGMSLQFIYRSSTASLLAGVAVCAISAFIFRASRGQDFAVQFGLATSFAGQALFFSGIMGLFRWGSGSGYFAIALFEAVLVIVIINSIHRVVSASASAISISLALSSFGAPHIALALITAGVAVVWLYELKWAGQGPLVRTAGYGLVLASIYVNSALLMHEPIWLGGTAHISREISIISYWVSVLLNSSVFIYAVSRLLLREGFDFHDRLAQVALIAALALSIASLKAPGIITGLIIVLLGFANGNRVLAGLGIFASIAYLSHYYYQMQTTLLVKAVSLAVTGTVLLVSRFALDIVWPDNKREGGSHA